MKLNSMNIAPNDIHIYINLKKKICVILLSSIRGIVEICFNWYIYKVEFSLYLIKLPTYLTNINDLLVN